MKYVGVTKAEIINKLGNVLENTLNMSCDECPLFNICHDLVKQDSETNCTVVLEKSFEMLNDMYNKGE